MRLVLATSAAAALLGVGSPARAAGGYAALSAATTVAYRAPGGPLAGPQADVTPLLGAALLLGETVAAELDVGPTFVSGEYASFSLVPAIVWAFSEHFYAAGRFAIPIDPEPDLVLLPGAGAIWPLANGLAPFVELDLWSAVGHGDPDLGLVLAAGSLYSF